MPVARSARLEDLETLLRARRLDRTLTSSFTGLEAGLAKAPVGLPDVDAQLRGGFPRGQMSEVVGSRSSGRTTIVHALLAAATARGELTALVDSLDTFDAPSAAAAHVDLQRLLWVRGPSIAHGPSSPGGQGLFHTATERAIKAFNLILQAGHFGVVVLDLADVPMAVVRRLPFTTWLRLQRVIEGGEPAGLLVAETSIGRSPRGLTLQVQRRHTDSTLGPQLAVASARLPRL
jgi:hypothetical protein